MQTPMAERLAALWGAAPGVDRAVCIHMLFIKKHLALYL